MQEYISGYLGFTVYALWHCGSAAEMNEDIPPEHALIMYANYLSLKMMMKLSALNLFLVQLCCSRRSYG